MASWSRQAGISLGFWSLASALALLSGCGSAPEPVDPRTPAALAAPTPAEWRAAAAGVAAEIAAAVESSDGGPAVVSLRPVAGTAAIDLRDTLLSELVLAGVTVAAPDSRNGESRLSLHCRVSPTGTTEPPRGVVAAAVDPTAETVLVCLLANRGRYVAAARRILRPHPVGPDDRSRGTVLEVTG